jgi:hypothetical protein
VSIHTGHLTGWRLQPTKSRREREKRRAAMQQGAAPSRLNRRTLGRGPTRRGAILTHGHRRAT